MRDRIAFDRIAPPYASLPPNSLLFPKEYAFALNDTKRSPTC